jgi:hypothetical protein
MDDTARRAHVALALAALKAGFPLLAAGKIHTRHAEGDDMVDQSLSAAESALDSGLEAIADGMRRLEKFVAGAGAPSVQPRDDNATVARTPARGDPGRGAGVPAAGSSVVFDIRFGHRQ